MRSIYYHITYLEYMANIEKHQLQIENYNTLRVRCEEVRSQFISFGSNKQDISLEKLINSTYSIFKYDNNSRREMYQVISNMFKNRGVIFPEYIETSKDNLPNISNQTIRLKTNFPFNELPLISSEKARLLLAFVFGSEEYKISGEMEDFIYIEEPQH